LSKNITQPMLISVQTNAHRSIKKVILKFLKLTLLLKILILY